MIDASLCLQAERLWEAAPSARVGASSGLCALGAWAGAARLRAGWRLFGGRTANALKARGVEPGTPDLLVLEPGCSGMHGLAVELKIDDNDLSDAQARVVRARTGQGMAV